MIALMIKNLLTKIARIGNRRRYRTLSVEEVPDLIKPRVVYAVGEKERPWMAALKCPCGCGESIQLSLLTDDFPSWKLSINRYGVPTLTPSVARTKGCGAHFVLRNGEIDWFAIR